VREGRENSHQRKTPVLGVGRQRKNPRRKKKL